MTRRYTGDEVLALAGRSRRWGRWGDDDQLGALNFIDASAIAAAATLVVRGRVISCALPYDEHGPQTGRRGRTNPAHHMLQDGGDIALGAQDHLGGLQYADDAVSMPLQAGTHWDAFSHVFHEGRMWNGLGLEHVTSAGAARNGIEALRDRLVGRGVLLDLPRHRGARWLAAGEGIGRDEILACAAAQGVELRRGDILLLRTGRLAQARAEGWNDFVAGDSAGLALDGAALVVEREIAAVAADTWSLEVRPHETDDVLYPVHIVLLVNAGVPIGEMFDLEMLAAECAAERAYEFMFVAAPLPFTGAVGAPLNPIAIM